MRWLAALALVGCLDVPPPVRTGYDLHQPVRLEVAGLLSSAERDTVSYVMERALERLGGRLDNGAAQVVSVVGVPGDQCKTGLFGEVIRAGEVRLCMPLDSLVLAYTTMHEFGHVLGARHIPGNNVMAAGLNTTISNNLEWVPPRWSQEDVAEICRHTAAPICRHAGSLDALLAAWGMPPQVPLRLPDCAPRAVTTAEVLAVTQTYCARSGCHGWRGPGDQRWAVLLLDTVRGLEGVMGSGSGQALERLLVDPGNPGGSYLLGKVLQAGRDMGGFGGRHYGALGATEACTLIRWAAGG